MKVTLNEGASSGAGGSINGNFCSFVFTEIGRRLLDEGGISLAKNAWDLASLHEDRRDVAVRFHDQEDRAHVHVHPEHERRLRDAQTSYDQLVARLSTPEGRASLIVERRELMRKREQEDRDRGDAQTRRMTSLMDELLAWSPAPVLQPLRDTLVEDIRNWRPASGYERPSWAATDDGLVAFYVESAEREVRRCREFLDRERAKCDRLNLWLTTMRATFGREPEGYWSDCA